MSVKKIRILEMKLMWSNNIKGFSIIFILRIVVSLSLKYYLEIGKTRQMNQLKNMENRV